VTAADLLAFNAMLLAAWIAPGPAMLVALRAAVTGGRRAGVVTGLGLATVSSLWTLAALLGLDALFRLAPWAYGALKVAGALYLMLLAWRTWRSASEPVPAGGPRVGRAFRTDLLVNLANPKSVLFSAAVLVVIFPAGLGPGAMAAIVANHLVVEAAAYALLAAAAGGGPAARTYLRAKPWLDRVTASVLGALGLRLVMDRS
jgi:threonine/homoserine/homoserine lactone efflux protein